MPTLKSPPPPAAAPSVKGGPAGAPPLRLIRFRVRDFRGIEDATVDLGETTVVMGENNVGKSALLEALDTVLGDRAAATTDLRIDATGVVAKRFTVDLELAAWSGDPLPADVIDLLGPTYRPEPGTQRMRYILRGLAEPDESQRTMRVRRFFIDKWDAPPESPALEQLSPEARRALWYSLLDAQRDLLSDLRVRGSPWGKLLRRLQVSPAQKAQFEAQLAQLSSQVMLALPDASKLASEMGNLQSVLAGQVESARLTLLPKSLDDLWRTTDLLVRGAGQAELSIGQQGMGARSLSSLLAFRAWLEAERLIATDPPVLVVTAYEEPEAHLHPQAQRAIFGEISAVAGQRIISTHSPYVAAVAKLDDFRVVRRGPPVSVASAKGISTSGAYDAASLENVRRFCLNRNADMLFARLVILGEGDTDALVLPELARVWWEVPAETRGVSLVPMDGANNAPTFAGFLERLGVPWLVLLDGDAKGAEVRAQLLAKPELALRSAQVITLEAGGAGVDFEHLIAKTARAAVAEAFGATPQHTAAIKLKPEADLVQLLESAKGKGSRRLGQELATAWPTRAQFPSVLHRLFSVADSLL